MLDPSVSEDPFRAPISLLVAGRCLFAHPEDGFVCLVARVLLRPCLRIERGNLCSETGQFG